MSDIITAPSHYTAHPSGIEPMDIAKHETFLRGNIIKYVMRAPYKGNEIQDLKKARQYIDLEIARAEEAYILETAENVTHPVAEKAYAPIEWRAQSDLKLGKTNSIVGAAGIAIYNPIVDAITDAKRVIVESSPQHATLVPDVEPRKNHSWES